MPELKDTELRILLVLLRSTVGWNRPSHSVQLTYAQLKQRTGRSSEAISRALQSLELRGLIHIARTKPQRSVRFPKHIASMTEEPL